MDQQDFYIQRDFNLLADTIKSELTFIRKHWRQPGRPTVTLLFDKYMFSYGKKAFLSLMRDLSEDRHIKIGRYSFFYTPLVLDYLLTLLG